jgi:phosphomannomutase / phosphoglucomutase
MSSAQNIAKMKPEVFREYDIRGIVATDFPADAVVTLGRAFGTYAIQQGAKSVALGHDCRESSPHLAASLKQGLMAAGMHVVEIGMVSTPQLYFATFEYDTDAGIQITGSHNPIEYNGFKLTLHKRALFGSEIQEVRKIQESGAFVAGTGRSETRDIVPAYYKRIEGDVKFARKFKVVIDGGNGMAGPGAVHLFSALGADVVPLFIEPDGTFPNHHPDPTVEHNLEALIHAVREHKADLGVAFDGDGDRVGVVDEHGKIIWGDMILLYLAAAISKEIPGAKFVADVKCSKVLFDEVAKRGGDIEMFKTGHSLIKARMKEVHAELAGEMSGHIFYKHRWYGFDDATYTALRYAEILTQSDAPLSKFYATLPATVSTPEIRLDIPEAKKWHVVEQAQKWFAAEGYQVNTIDGVRVTFADGWGLMRASNTQPVVVLRFEAESEGRLNEIEGLFRKKLAEWSA